MEEYFDVLDESGNKTGDVKDRNSVHRDGDWHRTVHLWIVSDHGDLYLQKRSAEFYLGEGLLDATVVGHVQAGQDSLSTAVREGFEELGLEIPADQVEFVGEDVFSAVGRLQHIEKYINNEFHDVFVWKSSLNMFDFKFDTQEMSGLELVTVREFEDMGKSRDERLVPQWSEYEKLLWYLGGK